MNDRMPRPFLAMLFCILFGSTTATAQEVWNPQPPSALRAQPLLNQTLADPPIVSAEQAIANAQPLRCDFKAGHHRVRSPRY